MSTKSQPIGHVTDTTFWIAAVRARESQRKDALFSDPLAGVLAQEKGEQILRKLKHRYIEWIVPVRTVMIDRMIQNAIQTGIDTILNLGAGLDTRPYRMDLPKSLQWIEADFAPMIAFKIQHLKEQTPRCALERHSIDLSDAEARTEFLDSIEKRTRRVLVLTEGVVPYLSNDDAGALAKDLAQRRGFELWILDYMSSFFMEVRRKRRVGGGLEKNAPFLFEPGDWKKFFADRGWKIKELRFFGPEAESMGRPGPVPWPVRLFSRWIPEENKRQIREMIGYALLER